MNKTWKKLAIILNNHLFFFISIHLKLLLACEMLIFKYQNNKNQLFLKNE